jgi:cell division protein FtsI/penicillin-binding protein 2
VSYKKDKQYQDNEYVSQAFRIRLSAIGIAGVGLFFIFRLFVLMVLQHDFYLQLASGTHDIYSKLFPSRGEVFVQDSRTKEEYPVAINRDYFLVYANTKEINDKQDAEHITNEIVKIFQYDDEKKLALLEKLLKEDDPYEPIEPKIDEDVKDRITKLELNGIHFIRKSFRFYPEKNLSSQVIGFLGRNSEGEHIGHYGIEGYWNKDLFGKGGFVEGAKSAVGGLIAISNLSKQAAEDGPDFLLTIDRTIQFKACQMLEESVKQYEAQSGSLVIMDPYSGAVRAMCTVPDFDPNVYNEVEDIGVYNNSAIFVAYEPGSIFKPIAVSAAINEGLMTPSTYFYDSGVIEGPCDTPIKNAGDKKYEDTNMTGVLIDSINTGMVHITELLGKQRFRDYVEDFGFGIRSGIELDTEVAGNISSLYENKGDKVDCYTATASFGQGITATPIQMTTAFSSIANGGKLIKPQIIDEIRYADGRIDRIKVKQTDEILDEKTASLVSAMLVNVVDKGHATGAQVPGYYVAGKTGTAQIAEKGKYIEETNHSFVGFAPVEHPRFVMIVKLEKPKMLYSSSTAAPTFGKIAKFLLQYYRVPPNRL